MVSIVLFSGLAAAAGPGLAVGPVEKVADGFEFTEGPIWLHDKGLLFSDINGDSIYRADKSVFRKPSGKSNGLTLDRQGRLIACEHWNRRVTRTESDGKVTVVADRYEGKRFNSPNDVVVRSDGVIFFTDPPYGLEQGEAELAFSGVFAVFPNGRIALLDTSFKRPNGLAFSPDERILYIGDSEESFIRAYDVKEDATLENGRLFCKIPNPDGMKVDERGRLWSTAGDGVRVYQTDGAHLGTIAFPEHPANCAFGDEDGKTLYVTARHGVYKVRCVVKGLRP